MFYFIWCPTQYRALHENTVLGMKNFMSHENIVLFALRFMIDCNIVGAWWKVD